MVSTNKLDMCIQKQNASNWEKEDVTLSYNKSFWDTKNIKNQTNCMKDSASWYQCK